MFKCAIVGVSGSRARGHVDAYQFIQRGQLVAISSRQQDKLDAFGDKYGIPARYTDYREMFAQERPDVVHVNTPPNIRCEVIEAAKLAGIPAVIVEKPIAIEGEDYTRLACFDKRCCRRIKVAVNHQLQFHPRRAYLQQFVQDGRIGEVRFIEASARMNLAYQGTHALQSIGAFNPSGIPVSVFGQVSGVDGLRYTPKRHFAPDQCVASIAYDNGIHAQLLCGANAPTVGDGPVNTHKRVAVYGTHGFVQWTMHGWESGCDGHVESGTHTYAEEDVLGQAAMTEAMFDWLEDDTKVHPLCLKNALRDFNIILGVYMSALNYDVIKLPVQPEPNLIASLRKRLEKDSA